ncbi:glycerol-3-phosphate phosphatase-like protein [Xylogone sp. PMI_703]|nr:glycerol-3-phosphate phosphatase-like protein [Xylogone sp. PMI_703]
MGSATPTFSAPPLRVHFHGLLFDMDGTIIDSTAAVEKHWHTIGNELGLDPVVILQTSHGRRSMDVLKLIKPEKANWEYICQMEGMLPKLYGDDATEIPGARRLLDQVTEAKAPWAIVTSGTQPLVTGWINVLKLPFPEHLVTAEHVENGKPDPTCYLMGKEKIGLKSDHEVLVLEDSPAGIKAGKAAGCKVLGVVTSHTVENIIAAEPDWIVKDLESVRVVGVSEDGVELEFVNALEMH